MDDSNCDALEDVEFEVAGALGAFDFAEQPNQQLDMWPRGRQITHRFACKGESGEPHDSAPVVLRKQTRLKFVRLGTARNLEGEKLPILADELGERVKEWKHLP